MTLSSFSDAKNEKFGNSSFVFSRYLDFLYEKKLVWVLVAFLFLMLGAFGLYSNHREEQSRIAYDMLHRAGVLLEKKIQSSSTQEKKNLDTKEIDLRFAEAITLFKDIYIQFKKTRPAFDACLKLGKLYLDEFQFVLATEWYEKALKIAPNRTEKAWVFFSLAYAHEGVENFSESVRFLNQALDLGEESLRGEMLVALFRNYRLLKDQKQAKIIYEKITGEFRGSEYAKMVSAFEDEF
jgi:tetratricopeptide (TPR) repeat protein